MASINDLFEQREYDKTTVGIDGYLITSFENKDVIDSPSLYDIILPEGNFASALYCELRPTKLTGDPDYSMSVKFTITMYISDRQGVVLVREYPDSTKNVPLSVTDLKKWCEDTAKEIVLEYHQQH